MIQIFLSHSNVDADAAHHLKERLLAERPNTMIALSSEPAAGPPGGTDWRWWIRRTMKACDIVILVATDASRSPWCSAELGMARLLDKPIIPLLVDDDPAVVNPIVAENQGASIDRPADELWRRIDDLVGPAPVATVALPPDFVPYPGLAALTEEQERLLGGRSDERRRILDDFDRLAAEPGRFVVVSGPSGSGKSSLVRAGVVPGLRARGWTIIGPTQPRQLIDDGLPAVVADRPAVVVVDQFEELDAIPAEDRSRVLAWLHAAVAGGASALVVVRSEFRTTVGEWIPKPIDHYVPFVAVEDLYEIIRGPAKLAQLDMDESLVDRLVVETGSGAALPLLAYALHELWQIRDRTRVALHASHLDSLGGVHGLLERRANEALHAASDGDPAVAADVLVVLTRLASTEHRPPTRTPIRSRTLSERERRWLDEFVVRGLVAFRTSYALDDQGGDVLGPSGDAVVDVTHEWLFEWRPLADAIDDERERNRLVESVTAAAHAWAAGGRSDASLLLGGDRLTEAVELDLHSAPGEVGEFVTASVRGDHARKVRRALTVGIAALAVVAVVAAGVAVVGFVRAADAQQEAERSEVVAQSVRLAARADQLVDVRRDEAMVTAVAAYRTDPNSDTEGALLNAIATPRGPLRYFADDTANWSTAMTTPAGRGLVVDRDLQPATVDLDTRELRPIPAGDVEISDVLPGRSRDEVLVWGRRPPDVWVVGTIDIGDGDRHLIEHEAEITAAVLGDGELLFGDVTGRVLAAGTGDAGWGSPTVVDSHPDAAITGVATDGDLLASASRAAIRIQRRESQGWATAFEIWSVQPGTPAAERLAFRPTADPPELYAVGSDPTIRRWRVVDGEVEEMPSAGADVGVVQALAFEPEGQVAFTAGREGHLQRWDATSGAPLGDALPAHRGVVLRVSASSATSVVTSDDLGTAVLWDLGPSRVIERSGVVPASWAGVAFRALVDGDGPVAGVTGDRIVVADGSELAVPPRVRRAWWTADRGVVVETGDTAQVDAGERDVWSIDTDGTTTLIAERVDAVAVNPCFAAVASGGQPAEIRSVAVAECAGATTVGENPVEVPGGAVVTMAWAPDGARLLVVRRDNSLAIVQADGAIEEVAAGRHRVVTTGATWLSDDLVAIGHDAGADVELIDLGDVAASAGDGSASAVRELRGHDDAVWWFASDGRRLATAGQDGRIVLSDIGASTPIGEPLIGARRERENDSEAVVRGLAWSDGGTLLAIHGSRIVAWDLDPDRLVDRNCRSAQHEHTQVDISARAVGDGGDPCGVAE